MGKKTKPAHQGDGPTGPVKSAQAKAQDDQVMATNNSSIVSKRSVEKLYYPTEPPFFRHFVAKFQRRAPLINRGYWLRLRAIDVLVRDFLRGAKVRGRRGVVVNLGCGSDVLPWQCLTRYPADCAGVKFVDVDFPDLIERKRKTVDSTPELLGMLTGVRDRAELSRPVVFESDQYVQIGCDLRDPKTLQKGLAATVGDFAECEFIFVAEVSITYMETEGADGVIQWASTLGDAEFVLLEQILPDGDAHPFAATMLSHFHKLNTQIKSVTAYPGVRDQHARFAARGWDSVRVWTLWQAWADETFLSASERRALDDIEPFDEWEEFALFATHYCVVHARTGSSAIAVPSPSVPSSGEIPSRPAAIQFDECPGVRGQRRFAAACEFPGEDGKPSSVLNVLGLGTKSRLQSCDLFGAGASDSGASFTVRDGGPTARMCHSLTDLGNGSVLLAGGRGSPSSPLKDCWLFDRSIKAWTRTHDLPTPLYRHSVVALGKSGLALLVGGRGETEVLDGCLLYSPEAGWVECDILGDKPVAVYGAVLSCVSGGATGHFSGIYAGGLAEGLISDQILLWEADISDTKKPTIQFTHPRISGNVGEDTAHWLLTRFGASCLRHGGQLLLLGGVARDHLLAHNDEAILCSISHGELTITGRLVNQTSGDEGTIPRPLFIGHSAVSTPDGNAVVVGGGATCFSMGTFWNKGVYSWRLPASGSDGAEVSQPTSQWAHEKTIDIIPVQRSVPVAAKQQSTGGAPRITPIPRVKLETADDFASIVRKGQPVVLEGLDLGSCVSAWTPDYLVDKVGVDRKVVIHEAATKAMDFTAKNFRYVTTDFGDFARRVGQGDRLYLRALSNDKPSERPAMLADDFPALAPDFVLPQQLSLVAENLFSSVLRMSGPVNMWLHYDVMANVYCQIGGSKRLLLFPPSDVEHLSFAPGASSSSIDVFSTLESAELGHTHPFEAVLSAGDVLFLPPLWLHTATPTSDKSIAVNVFFKDLDGGHYAPGRDVYGNRDLAAYEKGRQDVARMTNSFKKLPAEAREFYLLRLADELRGRARG
ncbi:hypothetical protein C8A05DRAFT_12582 [Staphylotrichum tortipilum]|uniref:tRNA wybutosine-synthesizing protein 4 n=1 Tax=Staphylotrichum tortipilum TaxID=2831512 RepID=A0AAN6MSC3_9PEZI|nr:hypothetical protein C8A05DRAFT_12582 [Staphylotrichum longicolle]